MSLLSLDLPFTIVIFSSPFLHFSFLSLKKALLRSPVQTDPPFERLQSQTSNKCPQLIASEGGVEVSELAALIGKCQEVKEFELQGFIILAACTGLRKSAILSRKWEETKLEAEFASFYLPKLARKNKRSNRRPLQKFCVEAPGQLPSYKRHDYLFPARPYARFREVEKFQTGHAMDIGKRS